MPLVILVDGVRAAPQLVLVVPRSLVAADNQGAAPALDMLEVAVVVALVVTEPAALVPLAALAAMALSGSGNTHDG